MSLYSQARAFEAGEQVEFEGRQYPSLYTPRNDTLIYLFQITDAGQRNLITFIA